MTSGGTITLRARADPRERLGRASRGRGRQIRSCASDSTAWPCTSVRREVSEAGIESTEDRMADGVGAADRIAERPEPGKYNVGVRWWSDRIDIVQDIGAGCDGRLLE